MPMKVRILIIKSKYYLRFYLKVISRVPVNPPTIPEQTKIDPVMPILKNKK